MRISLFLLICLAATSAPALAAASLDSSPVLAKPHHFWQHHVLLANASHLAGGFGLALVLRRYLPDKPALKALGWLLLAFAIATHFIAILA